MNRTPSSPASRSTHASSLAVALTIGLFVLAALQAPAAEVQATTLAVFPFATPKDMDPEEGKALAELISAELSRSPSILAVERAELEKSLGEMELGLSGVVEAKSAVKAGAMLGARALVTGRIIQSGKERKAIAKVIGTATGQVFTATETIPLSGGFEAASKALAGHISQIVEKNRDAIVGEPETFELVVAKLKLQVQGKQLPTVNVVVPEEHLSRRVPDPAAETEIKRVLEAVGFKVLSVNAQVNVKGEAFSEFGMRKGNLVACRARLEVTVQDTRAGGKEWVDIETAGAVDLSEHMAAKSALQEAGLRMAQRLVGKLVAGH